MWVNSDSGDWLSVVLTASDQQAYAASYSLVQAQLGLALRQRPAVYVGCSMTDPRLLDWLRDLPTAERRALQPGRAVLTVAEWERLGLEVQELLASANIRPVQVADHGAVSQLFAALAKELVPVEPDELVIRRFEPTRFRLGSLYDDFVDAAGLGIPTTDRPERERNESLDAEAVEFLRILNLYRVEHPEDSDLPKNRELVPTLTRLSTGPTLTLPGDILERFMEQWAD